MSTKDRLQADTVFYNYKEQENLIIVKLRLSRFLELTKQKNKTNKKNYPYSCRLGSWTEQHLSICHLLLLINLLHLPCSAVGRLSLISVGERWTTSESAVSPLRWWGPKTTKKLFTIMFRDKLLYGAHCKIRIVWSQTLLKCKNVFFITSFCWHTKAWYYYCP